MDRTCTATAGNPGQCGRGHPMRAGIAPASWCTDMYATGATCPTLPVRSGCPAKQSVSNPMACKAAHHWRARVRALRRRGTEELVAVEESQLGLHFVHLHQVPDIIRTHTPRKYEESPCQSFFSCVPGPGTHWYWCAFGPVRAKICYGRAILGSAVDPAASG